MSTTVIEETSLETLTARIIKGINFCNDTWQQARATEDVEKLNKLMALLDAGTTRLQDLIIVAKAHGLTVCVFGSCKWSDDNFICFGCTK